MHIGLMYMLQIRCGLSAQAILEEEIEILGETPLLSHEQ